MADFDQTEEYRKFVSELNPTSLPIVRISGGRKQRFEHFKKQFQQLKTEMAFG